MPEYNIRITDEKGETISDEIAEVLELNLRADAEFKVTPSLFPTTVPPEYTLETDAEYITLSLNLGKITLFTYSGKPKNIEIRLTGKKISSIKNLLG